MKRALIGYTGFVGGNLLDSTTFTDLYNSKNIEAIAGETFDEIICVGAPAAMWIANREPEKDWENIERLLTALRSVKCSQMTLISTVAVFKNPNQVTEDDKVELEGLSPYGIHRFKLEEFMHNHFETLTLRLPGLFGKGLKKNVIYDFLNNNLLEQINSRSVYQYYNLANLWRDINRARENKLSLLHLTSEPVSVAEVAKESFGMEFDNDNGKPPVHFDFRSRYDYTWGGKGGYLYDKATILREIEYFVTSENSK